MRHRRRPRSIDPVPKPTVSAMKKAGSIRYRPAYVATVARSGRLPYATVATPMDTMSGRHDRGHGDDERRRR